MTSSTTPSLSSLSNLISSHALQSQEPGYSPASASINTPSSPYTTLALQVQHNLLHQHYWTALKLHTCSPLPEYGSLPRPLISGLPPSRLYVYPDQQARELAEQDGREAAGAGGAKGAEGSRAAEREWVLPAHLQEKWSLRKLAEVFDALPEGPPGEYGEEDEETKRNDRGANWPAKRVLLAILNDDSTVNYYIMHDGIVKPRQN